MGKHPLDNVCLERCPFHKMHHYNETTQSCTYKRENFIYCTDSFTIDGLDELMSQNVTKCTFIDSLTIRNIPIPNNSSFDVQSQLFKIFGGLGDIRRCLLIENSPGITSLHFMPNLGEVRGNCKDINESKFSTIIRNNENLHHFFMQGFLSKKGALWVENNTALCQDEIANFMKQSEVKEGSLLQNSTECEIPVVKFHVIPSYTSALIHIDKLKDGVDYKLRFREKFSNESMNERDLVSDAILLDFTPNKTYEMLIASKRKGDQVFRFLSALKEFKMRSFENFLNITNITVTPDSAFIQWKNLNKIKNAFYLVHIDQHQPAYQVKNGWNRKLIFLNF